MEALPGEAEKVNLENKIVDDVKINYSSNVKETDTSPQVGWRKLKKFMDGIRHNLIVVPTRDDLSNTNDLSYEDEFTTAWGGLDNIKIPSTYNPEDAEFEGSLNSMYQDNWLRYSPGAPLPRPVTKNNVRFNKPFEDQRFKRNPSIREMRALKIPQKNVFSDTYHKDHKKPPRPIQPRRFDMNSEEKLFPPKSIYERTLQFFHEPPRLNDLDATNEGVENVDPSSASHLSPLN